MKTKPRKLVVSVVKYQVSKNWNALQNYYLRWPVSHHLQFFQPPEGASSRLRKKGNNNCLISIVGRHSKGSSGSTQDNQRNPHFYCHLTIWFPQKGRSEEGASTEMIASFYCTTTRNPEWNKFIHILYLVSLQKRKQVKNQNKKTRKKTKINQ